MKHIVILTHEHDRFGQQPYFLGLMAEAWRQGGHAVSVHRGPGKPPQADLAILHCDFTVVPGEYLALVPLYPRVINGRVADISKRSFSRQLVARGDGWQGPVLVKNNLNSGGLREASLASQGGWWQRRAARIRRALPGYMTTDYKVFNSVGQVPWAYWANPGLVVERFLPERRGGLHCLRTWMFFGSRETHSLCVSENPIVKGANITGREPLPTAEVPQALRDLRWRLGFDYGKFDYALVGGQAVTYDVNRTPAYGSLGATPFVLANAHHLAQGIEECL